MHKVIAGLSAIAMLAAAPSVKAADYYRGSTKDTYVQQAAPVYNWNGTYFGLSVGGANMNSKVNQQFPQFNVFGVTDALVLDTIGADRAINGDSSDESVIGGFHVGTQRQFNQLVLGGELGLSGADLSSSGKCWNAGRGFDFAGGPANDFSYNASTNCQTSVDWVLDAVAKVGYAYNPQWLVYANVGYAVAGTTHKQAFSYRDRIGLDGANTLSNSLNFTQAQNETMHGITWGLGVDYAATENFILSAEYRRYDLSSDGGGILGASDRDLDMNVFKIKASIKTN